MSALVISLCAPHRLAAPRHLVAHQIPRDPSTEVPCPHCGARLAGAGNDEMSAALDAALAAVMACESPDLGVNERQARDLLVAIELADREDDDALRAYDLLHQRGALGRAW